MLSSNMPAAGTDLQPSSAYHRAFLSKLERDQRARRANTHRHQLSWFIFDFSWETTDAEALAQDLARSEHLYQDELEQIVPA